MRRLGAVLAVGLLMVGCVVGLAEKGTAVKVDCVKEWSGEIDSEFVERVGKDLHKASQAGCVVFKVGLFSPGGGAVQSVEVSQIIKRHRQAGLTVEIHGRSLVASGAIFILAAGSPGHRFIQRNSLTVIHGVQVRSFEGQSCVGLDPGAKDERGRLVNGIIMLLVTELAESTGRSWAEVAGWFECGKERIASGYQLVEMGIADHEEG